MGRRQPSADESLHTLPLDASLLAPPFERVMPEVTDREAEVSQCVPVARHSEVPDMPGLIPIFRTEPSTIFVFRKVRKDVEEQAHGSADDRGGQADGSRPEGRGYGPRGGRQHAYDLCLEVEIQWHECERGRRGLAPTRRKLPTEETGGGFEPGQGHATVGQ